MPGLGLGLSPCLKGKRKGFPSTLTDGTCQMRQVVRGDYLCTDVTLTALGFTGVESTDGGLTGDWVCVESVSSYWSPLNPEAVTFFASTGITDKTQKQAIDQFITDLKAINTTSVGFVDFATPANGVLKAVYPFVGGTANTHKFNLIDPRDADAAFRLDFNGTITHDSNGVLPDGATAYADTHLIPTNVLSSVNSVSLAYYSLTNNTKDAFDIGTYKAVNSATCLGLKYTALGGLVSYISGSGNGKVVVATDTRGLFLSNRITGTNHTVYRNQEAIGFSDLTNTGLAADAAVYLFAVHNTSGGDNPLFFTDRRCCYAHITNGIPAVAVQLYIKAVQDLQTRLGRGYAYVPLMATSGSPAASSRVKVNIAGWNANVWHSLYLPSNYSTSRTWPIIIELPGNLYSYGNGTPDDYYMGHGLSQGKDFIWVVAPFLNTLGTANAPTWWGDGTINGDYAKTIEYWDAIIADLVANYHGDSTKVVLMGFSRGAIAVNFIGTSSDIQAAKFVGFMPHSHHDGGTFTPVDADVRIARMLGKKTCITYGGTTLDGGYANSQTGLGIVQAEGVTEEHYQIADMGHDIEHSLRNGDTNVTAIRSFLAQYK